MLLLFVMTKTEIKDFAIKILKFLKINKTSLEYKNITS